jgi:hypothetical protein
MAGKGRKKNAAANASKTTSGDAGNSAPPSTGGRPLPRQRGAPSSVPEGERSEQQARADEAEAAALTADSGSSRISGGSDLTPEEVRIGAEFLQTMKRKFGEVSNENLSRVMTSGLVGALNYDALTALPTSEARSGGRPSAPSAPEVQITGHSKPAPEPSNQLVVAAAVAAFVSSRVTFAKDADTYASYPAVATDRQSAENELTRHLRTAMQDAHPTAGTLHYILCHCAQAALFLIGGIEGERVSAMIYGQAQTLSAALASIGSTITEAMDTAAITKLLCCELLRHLSVAGTDPAAYVRKRLLELCIEAERRVVKQVLGASASARPQAQPPYGIPMSPHPKPPPGLGYAHVKQPVPPMVGLPGQNVSDRLNRWIRYPRDA